MKKWLSILGIMLVSIFFSAQSVNAFSWTWHELGESDGVKVYIAESSFKSNLLNIQEESEYEVDYWMKVSNGKAEATSHLMGRINKETKKMYYKVIKGEEILEDGTIVSSKETDWIEISPNSAEEYILGEVLKYDLERRTNELKAAANDAQSERSGPNNDRRD